MAAEIHSEYMDILPDRFSGLRSFKGWVSRLPTSEVASGNAELFNDGRISWLIEQYGDLRDQSVLELGPFEAGHTYLLHRNGAHIDAIEAKLEFYLKCLCIKEAYGLNNANFYLGSFVRWLLNVEKSYDLIVASGVLYHMTDPIQLLEILSARTKNLFLWTHYAPAEMYPDDHPLRQAYVGLKKIDYRGEIINLHKRSYLKASQDPLFCGGVRDDHCWLERDGILTILRRNGFVKFSSDEYAEHPNGPSFSLYAEK